MDALTIKDLWKTFRGGFIPRARTVLRGITLDVRPGEIFAFLGPNGAGKTTTIKAIIGLISPSRGDVTIFGRAAGTIEAKRRIGYLPENPYFYQYLRADEFLQFNADLCGVPRRESRGKIPELLRRVGLSERLRLPIRKFSKGMVQRLGLAQSMINDPDLLILDEPLSGLDPVGRKEFRDIILDLRRQGRTVFFSSHILQDAEMICDRAAILVDGTVRRIGTLDELTAEGIAGYELSIEGCDSDRVQDLGDVITIQGRTTFLRVSDQESLDRALAEIPRRGGRIQSVVPGRRTLEDVFMGEVQKG